MKHADHPMRRSLLKLGAALPLGSRVAAAVAIASPKAAQIQWARPGSATWPTSSQLEALRSQLSADALIKVNSPWPACISQPAGDGCAQLFRDLKNPYFIGEDVALTQTLGWVDAWVSSPSAYAVAAARTEDVVAAVNFARTHNLRLVVKGGGHSYQGTSNAAESLLVWTRRMNRVELHDAFVPRGCVQIAQPVPAVSLQAGAVWAHAYDAVTTRAGRYVQGGGCMTVGVAGLVQSGGFGSFSKAFGLVASNLLEAEVVTADGQVRIANACSDTELFWALKGGGGGSFGVVTRVTLRTHELPETFGAVNFTVRANTDRAYRRLVELALLFYRKALLNPSWGEQMRFRPDNVLTVSMVFQGVDRSGAIAIWQPFFDRLDQSGNDYSVDLGLKFVSTSARSFWSPTLIKRALGLIKQDERPAAPQTNVFWPGDEGQVGQFLHAYQSAWLPASLLRESDLPKLADAMFAATRHWPVALHFNKGLAGAPAAVVREAAQTAMNPVVLDAFALAICAAGEQPAYPGVSGHEPHVKAAQDHAARVNAAMRELLKLTPGAGSYVSESNYFEPNWQQSFWGPNYSRLLAVKQSYDPMGLFFVHHGAGSEERDGNGSIQRRLPAR